MNVDILQPEIRGANLEPERTINHTRAHQFESRVPRTMFYRAYNYDSSRENREDWQKKRGLRNVVC
jgi:hypothetical protein